MTDKKDKPEDSKSAFEEVAEDVGREVRGYWDYLRKGSPVKDVADSIRHHGKDRLKTGAATTAKVAALTWKTGPLMKVTLPAAFAIGAIGGPKASEYTADKLEKAQKKVNDWLGFKDEADESGDEPPKPKAP